MKPATEAKKLTQEALESQDGVLMAALEKDVWPRIETAARAGQSLISFPKLPVPDYLSLAAAAALEKLGYKVKHSSDQRDESYTTVSWNT